MSSGGAKFFSKILWLGIILLLAGLAFSSWTVYSRYSAEANSASAQHKRILVDLADGASNGKLFFGDDKDNAAPKADGGTTGSGGVAGGSNGAEENNNPQGEGGTSAQGGVSGGAGGGAAEEPKPQAPNATTTNVPTPPVKSEEIAQGGAAGGAPGSIPAAHAEAAKEKPAPAAVPTAAATPAAAPKVRVSVIIAGLGLSKSSTSEAMKLPAAIDFSFSPYSASLDEWFAAAHGSGHEILMDLPMEPNDYPITDPGPYALLTSLSKDENLSRLKALLSLGDANLAGLVAGKDEKFSSSSDNLAAIMAELKSRNLRLYFSDRNTASPVYAFSNSFDVPVLFSDISLDDKITEDAIKGKLAELEKTAKEKGWAIGIARPYPLTTKTLEEWAPGLAAKGIALVPAGEISGANPPSPNLPAAPNSASQAKEK